MSARDSSSETTMHLLASCECLEATNGAEHSLQLRQYGRGTPISWFGSHEFHRRDHHVGHRHRRVGARLSNRSRAKLDFSAPVSSSRSRSGAPALWRVDYLLGSWRMVSVGRLCRRCRLGASPYGEDSSPVACFFWCRRSRRVPQSRFGVLVAASVLAGVGGSVASAAMLRVARGSAQRLGKVDVSSDRLLP
jgi:hypothetical protein